MNKQQRKEISQAPVRRRTVEMLVFLAVSAIGIYALGNGLASLFEPGKAIDMLWLAVSAVSLMILFAQMGRVQDSWPRRSDHEGSQAMTLVNNETAQLSQEQVEERLSMSRGKSPSMRN